MCRTTITYRQRALAQTRCGADLNRAGRIAAGRRHGNGSTDGVMARSRVSAPRSSRGACRHLISPQPTRHAAALHHPLATGTRRDGYDEEPMAEERTLDYARPTTHKAQHPLRRLIVFAIVTTVVVFMVMMLWARIVFDLRGMR